MSEKTKRIILYSLIGTLIIVAVVLTGLYIQKNHQEEVIREQRSRALTHTVKTPSTLPKISDGDASFNAPANSKHVFIDEDGIYQMFTGVAQYTFPDLDSKPQLYYFQDGVLNQSYIGLAYSYVSGDPENRMYYVRNGRVDRSFTGIVLDDGYHKYVQNGIFNPKKNGTVTVNGKKVSLVRGILESDFYAPAAPEEPATE